MVNNNNYCEWIDSHRSSCFHAVSLGQSEQFFTLQMFVGLHYRIVIRMVLWYTSMLVFTCIIIRFHNNLFVFTAWMKSADLKNHTLNRLYFYSQGTRWTGLREERSEVRVLSVSASSLYIVSPQQRPIRLLFVSKKKNNFLLRYTAFDHLFLPTKWLAVWIYRVWQTTLQLSNFGFIICVLLHKVYMHLYVTVTLSLPQI